MKQIVDSVTGTVTEYAVHAGVDDAMLLMFIFMHDGEVPKWADVLFELTLTEEN
jgi:hypothetical protein